MRVIVSRIRAFYSKNNKIQNGTGKNLANEILARKVKFTQETFTEKFTAITSGFPKLDDL